MVSYQRISSGWQVVELGEVTSLVQNGIYKSAENYGLGHPFIRMYNIQNTSHNLCLNPLARILLDEDELKTYELATGDLLISRVNSFELVGKCAWVSPAAAGYAFENMLIRVRFDASVYPLFIALQMGTQAIRQQIEGFAKKASGQASINSSDIRKIQVVLPPIKEQKRIATIAQKADRLRRTRRYTLELSDSYLRSVFLEMFGDLEKNSKAFSLCPFDDVCVIDAEMVDPKLKQYRNYLHIGGANIESITGNLLDLKTAEEEGLISGKFLINPEHILFSKIRPKLRKVAYPGIHGLCSADIYPIRVCNPECNSHFLLYYLRSEYFSKIVSELAESRTNIPKVNREELSEQSIPLPPLSLQQKFAQIVQRFERLRIQQREAERQAELLFQTILHRGFRGEL